jgi:hypothetical protein
MARLFVPRGTDEEAGVLLPIEPLADLPGPGWRRMPRHRHEAPRAEIREDSSTDRNR